MEEGGVGGVHGTYEGEEKCLEFYWENIKERVLGRPRTR